MLNASLSIEPLGDGLEDEAGCVSVDEGVGVSEGVVAGADFVDLFDVGAAGFDGREGGGGGDDPVAVADHAEQGAAAVLELCGEIDAVEQQVLFGDPAG